MKIVYFGFDIFLPCLAQLVADGHEIIHIFTFSTDQKFDFNTRTLQAAEEIGCPVTLARPTPRHVEELIEHGAKAFVSAAYAYKIPPIPESRAYGLNIHPTLLPKGRSRWPLPYILLDQPEAAGITIHKLSPTFDAGDILAQKPLSLGVEDDLETLTAKIVMQTPPLLSELMQDLPARWAQAQPQDEDKASFWPLPDEEFRRIDWSWPVDEILRRHRAFGRAMVLAELEGQKIWIESLNGWSEVHPYPPGHIVMQMDREIVVAARDGLVVIKSWLPYAAW